MALLSAAGIIAGLLSPLAEVWVGRLHRRTILIIADLALTVVLLTVPLAAVAHLLSMPQLYAVVFITAALDTLLRIAYVAYLPDPGWSRRHSRSQQQTYRVVGGGRALVTREDQRHQMLTEIAEGARFIVPDINRSEFQRIRDKRGPLVAVPWIPGPSQVRNALGVRRSMNGVTQVVLQSYSNSPVTTGTRPRRFVSQSPRISGEFRRLA